MFAIAGQKAGPNAADMIEGTAMGFKKFYEERRAPIINDNLTPIAGVTLTMDNKLGQCRFLYS